MKYKLAEFFLCVFFSYYILWLMLNDSDCSWCICVSLIHFRSYISDHHDQMLHTCCIFYLFSILWWHAHIHNSWSTAWFCNFHEITHSFSVYCETTDSHWSTDWSESETSHLWSDVCLICSFSELSWVNVHSVSLCSSWDVCSD